MTFQEIDGKKRLAMDVPRLLEWYLDILEMSPVELSEHLDCSRQAMYAKMTKASSLSERELVIMVDIFKRLGRRSNFFWAQVQMAAKV